MKSKSLLLTAVATLCIAIVGFAQNVPSYVPTNGLVGWWPFNGDARDESGNGNNGTVNGATLTTDRFGNINRAYYFSGNNNNKIIVPNSSRFNFDNEFTISLWAILQQTWVYHTKSIIYKGGTPYSNGWHIGIDQNDAGNGQGKYRIQAELLGSGVADSCCNPFSHINSWKNYTLVYKNNIIKLYLDGILLDSSLINNPIINNAYDIEIGGSLYPVTGPDNRSIDDIAIYNRALTQQEITNLYNASTTPIPCPTLPSNLQTGLVGFWPFCGNANDESGNGNNGTVNGATLTADRFGNAGKAYSFDGVNNFIQVPISQSLNLKNSFSISVWYRTDSLVTQGSNYRPIFVSNERLSNAVKFALGYGINSRPLNWINNSTATICSTCNVELYGPNQISVNTWSNITGTWDGAILKIYENGFLTASSPALLPSDTLTSSNLPIFFGKLFSTLNPIFPTHFKGQLDDICIWNRALDSTEVSQLYQTQSTTSSNGNVGVNVVVPQRSLHIKDVMRMEPRSTAPENPVKGDIYFDGVLNKLRVYDGTAWQNCW